MKSDTKERAVMQFYVYVHCRPDGSPFYVGKGVGNRSHDFRKCAHRNQYHQNVTTKYGKDNIEILLLPCETEVAAFELEKRLIMFFGRQDIGAGCLVNMNDGGSGACIGNTLMRGKKHSLDTIAKMSASRVGTHPSNETRLKLSAAKVGNKNALGSKHSESTKQKISIALIGRKMPPRTAEWSAKISLSAKTRSHMRDKSGRFL